VTAVEKRPRQLRPMKASEAGYYGGGIVTGTVALSFV
jgi:hypothetical protein